MPSTHLSAREDEDFPSPPDHPERTYVPAEFYFRPSLTRAAQELDLLLAIEGSAPPSPAHGAENDEWLSEVARELEWIRNHPPIWGQPLHCVMCGVTEAADSGPPRNDGRPRQSGIAPTFRPGVGMTTAHIGPCPITTQPDTHASTKGTQLWQTQQSQRSTTAENPGIPSRENSRRGRTEPFPVQAPLRPYTK